MQEYRFKESGYTFYITWNGEGWTINRITDYCIMRGVGGKFQSRDLAIEFARRHYKIIKDLVCGGHY